MKVDPAGLVVATLPGERLPALLRSHPGLVAEMARPSFFCSADWFEAVLRRVGPTRPTVLVASSDSVPIAVLPLQRARNRIGGVDFRFLGYRFHPDPLGLICASNNLSRACAAMKTHLRKSPGWHRLVLDYLDADEASAWGGESQHQSVAPFLSLSPDFVELLQGFTKKKRYKIRASMAAAESAGASFIVATDPHERQEWLEILFRLHALRSDEIGRESSLASEAALHLHRDLVRNSGAVRLFALVLKGRPLAILYGFLHHRRFAYYQVAHDPAFASLSPGSVLLSRVIEWCCQHNVQEFDFLQGDESYKFRWACGQRELKRAMITSGRPAARIASCVDGAIKSVLSRLGGAA